MILQNNRYVHYRHLLADLEVEKYNNKDNGLLCMYMRVLEAQPPELPGGCQVVVMLLSISSYLQYFWNYLRQTTNQKRIPQLTSRWL